MLAALEHAKQSKMAGSTAAIAQFCFHILMAAQRASVEEEWEGQWPDFVAASRRAAVQCISWARSCGEQSDIDSSLPTLEQQAVDFLGLSGFSAQGMHAFLRSLPAAEVESLLCVVHTQIARLPVGGEKKTAHIVGWLLHLLGAVLDAERVSSAEALPAGGVSVAGAALRRAQQALSTGTVQAICKVRSILLYADVSNVQTE